MRRTATLILPLVGLALTPLASSADAATKPAVMKYQNCTALNKKYPHGVGKAGARDHVAKPRDIPVKNFTVNTAVYNANSRALDRDHDGIACEKR